MNANEWRNQRWNRRCRFCKHCKPKIVGLEQAIIITCVAKDTYLTEIGWRDLPRPFCKVFELKED